MEQKKYRNNRYALCVQYMGANFAGSQAQPGQKTVQSEIENAINILTKENNRFILAGRTDAGVHALSQAGHFDTDLNITDKKFVYALNSILPPDISIKGIKNVDKSFHSQKSARYRWYRYIINNTPYKSVFLNEISIHIHQELNLEEMQKALLHLLGEHDCSSFKSSQTDNPAKICNILYASCKNFSGIINIDLIANRFLYNMIRTIMGTLIQIGTGKYQNEHLREVLESKDRKNAGPTLDARGLTLMGVGYHEKYNMNEIMKMEAINEQNLLCKAS